ncbi:MAG: flagellar export chaperone FliS [Magnetococcales bacterium]|nr:flagellar export chaperone FliS [Magnetococcales bacterium]
MAVEEMEQLSPLDLLIRLYEGAINFLKQSADDCKAERMDSFKENLRRGRRIIEEFQRTLDFKQGGQITAQLNDLYTYMLDSLRQFELTHDELHIERVIDQLETLLEGWRGAQYQAVA